MRAVLRPAIAGSLLLLGSCRGPGTFVCSVDEDCAGGAGLCVGGSCAGPDADCESGFRFEDVAAGDFAGQCVPAMSTTSAGSTTAMSTSTSAVTGAMTSSTSNASSGSSGTGNDPMVSLMFLDDDTGELVRFPLPAGPPETVCTFNVLYSALGVLPGSPTRLLAAGQSGFAELDPCSCAEFPGPLVSMVDYSGIAVDPDTEAVYIIDGVADALLLYEALDTPPSVLTMLDLNVSSFAGGWLTGRNTLGLFSAGDDTLYEIDIATGTSTPIVTSAQDFGSVGFEVPPGSNTMFACDRDATLYEIDLQTGTTVATQALRSPCNNLALLLGPLDCP